MSGAIIWRREKGNEKFFSNQSKLPTESIEYSPGASSQENPHCIPTYMFCDPMNMLTASCKGLAHDPMPLSAGVKSPVHPCNLCRSHKSGPQRANYCTSKPWCQVHVHRALFLGQELAMDRHTKGT